MMRIMVPLLVVGLMSVSAGVAFGDSHGDGGNATSTDDGLATSTDDGLATSTDDGTDGEGEKRQAFVGIISWLATSTVGTTTVYSGITLTQKGTEESVSIYLGGDEIQYKYPGGPNSWDSLEEAYLGGAEIVVLTRQDEDGNDAIFVLVKPKRPTFTALVGTVIGTEDGVTTLLLPNGKTKKVRKPEGDEDPEDGEVLTVIVENTGDGDGEGDADADADGEVAEATGLVKASKIAERIESFLAKLAANDASLPQAVIDARQRLVTNLATVLDKHSTQQVSILEKAGKAQGLGSGAAARLQEALANAEARRDNGKAIADDAKDKVGVAHGAGNIGNGGPAPRGSDDDDGDDDSPSGSGKPSDKGKPVGAGAQSGGKGGK